MSSIGRGNRSRSGGLLALVVVLCLVQGLTIQAQEPTDPILARSKIIITGGGIAISPAHQVVPRNIATIVETVFGVPGENGNGPEANDDLRAAFPADAILVAELVGPSLGQAVTLTTRAGEPFKVQPLAIAGLHYLRGIRLVSGGATLLAANPDTVTLEVIDQVLVSQVTSRPLSADEIRDRGIVIDQTNYQVINFSAAFGFQSKAINISFPMIVPTRAGVSLAPAAPPLELPALQPTVTPAPSIEIPKLIEAFQTANVSVGGLFLKVEDEDVERAFSIPPLSGVVVIPGNIAYLNQFFSILTLVSNSAPGHSNLTAHDVKAEIILPSGTDTVAGSGDDPLRMAKLGSPPAEQPRVLPVTLPGVDGKLGTADDVLVILPQQSGNSEHLVEGLREGTHTIEIKVSAMLHGLPIGPVAISGRVLGTVEVRNPTFALTLSHPATITAGEDYDLHVTLTNTSRSPANLASVNLLPRSISGATLLSNQSVQIESIAAGDSQTVTFRLRAQTTGTVTATSFTSEGIPGRFELTTAVGALGIPMSPNTLVLPTAANSLPAALRNAGVGFLGQAFALATSPVTPEGLLPIGQQIVYDRGTTLAQAGQRASLQEPLSAIARDLLLDWSGSEFARLPERYGTGQATALARAQQDFRGMDELFRRSRRGREVLDAIGSMFGEAVSASGLTAFVDAWSEAAASRAPHVAVFAAPLSPGLPLAVEIIDPSARHLGLSAVGGAIASDVPFGSFVPLTASGDAVGQLAVITTPESGQHEAAVRAGTAGTFNFNLVVPDGSGLRRLSYSNVTVGAGVRARVRFVIGGANAYALEVDDDGDGSADRAIEPSGSTAVVDAGPKLLGASQILTGQNDGSAYGQVVALVFSEEVSRASAQDGLSGAQLTNYHVEGNDVVGAAVQPGGRVVLLSLRDGLGPLVARHVTVTGIEDRLGNPMSPSPATALIETEIGLDGGTIAGRVIRGSGTPVPNARIRLIHTVNQQSVTVSVKDADANGAYSFDFVRTLPTTLEAIDSENGERGEVHAAIRHGQRLDLDVVLLGTGTVAGRALSPAGAPLVGAVVRVSSLTRFGEILSALTDASGAFSIAGVPVGNITIEAAHSATNSRTVRASTVPVAGGVVVENLTLIPLVEAAVQTGSIAGQVFRADGVTPAAGIPVFTSRGGIATTDASGAYRIDLLPTGEITIRAIDQARIEQATIVTTVVANTVITANLRLFGGVGKVRGVVLDADGIPVSGAQVGGGATLQTTNATGAFELQDVPLGQRPITALHAPTQSTGSIIASLTVPNETVNVQIVLEARGTITGIVTDGSGAPVPGLKVFLLGGLNLAGLTNAQGGYRFEHVPVGSYQVSAFTPDFSDGNIVTTRLAFRGEVRVANVKFRGKGTVTGTVLAADGETPLGARVGLSELRVKVGQLRPPENFNCFSNIQVGDQTIELPQCQPVGIGFGMEPLTRVIDNDVASGKFTFTDVLVGGVTVEAANALTPIVMTARGEIPAHGSTVDLTLKLAPTSVVAGVVLLPDGQPAGADVVVTLSGRNVVTDANGRFVHFEVAPGSFTLTASDNIRTGFVGTTSGTVAPGVTAEIPIRLLGKGSIAVEVRGVNGVVPNAQVRVRAGGFPNEEREGITGPTGQIVFAGGDSFFEGPFSVTAFDPASAVSGFTSGTIVRDAQVEITVQLPNEAGVVEGRFLNTAGTQPIPNAQIRLSSSGGDAFATTLADGIFHFDGVRLGAVTIEGFDPVTARRGRATGTLNAHGQTLSIDVRQIAQGTVRGFVRLSTDQSAVSAADVTISVNSVFGAQFRTTTNADGSFSFPGVSAGTFSLSATGSGLSGSATGQLEFEAEVVAVDVVLQVPERGRVEGHVTTASGEPAVGAQVLFGSRVTTVDNSGFYFFDDVGMGTLTVRAVASLGPDGGVGTGSLVYSGEVALVNIAFVGTGAVSGIVRSGGSPVPFAIVTLSTRNKSGRNFGASTQTDANGAYSFPSAPVGDVSVTAVQTGTQLAGTASGTLAAPGDTIDLPVALQPSAAIRARVLRESTNTPVGAMAVEVVGASRRFGSTSGDGTFRFTNLALGTYQVLVTDPLGEGLVRGTVTLDEGGEEIDLGDLVLDEFYPEVQSVTPADGTARVPVNQSVAVQFSERIDPSSLNATAIVVSTAAGSVAGSWSLSADARTATFTASAPYADFTQVNVKVTTAIKDRVGRALKNVHVSAFQTTDSLPPAVLSASPTASAVGTQLNAVIRISYSEAINPAAFTGPAIVLTLNGAAVGGTITPVLNNTALVFTPSQALQANATYSVTVRPATDVFGNIQAQGLAYSFSTIDTLAPSIGSLVATPTSAFEGSTVSIVAQIAGASDVATVEFLLNGSVVTTDSTAPYQASIPVSPALRPSFSVSARATDTSGNIGSPATVTVDVQTDTAPAVTILTPSDGASANTGSLVQLRVRGTDDLGVSRIAYQTSGSFTTSGAFNVNPPVSSQEVTFTVSVPPNAAPGPLLLRAATTDTAGASSPTASVSITLNDVTVPTVQFVSPAPGTGLDAGQSATVIVSAADNGELSSISVETTGAAVFTATRPVAPPAASAQVSFDIPIPASTPEGQSLNVTVRAHDVAGNQSTLTSRTFPVIVPDTTPPLLTDLTTVSGSTRVLQGETASLRATFSDNVGVTALVVETHGATETSGVVPISPPVLAGNGTVLIPVPASVANGATISVHVRARDAASNLSDERIVTLTVGDTATPLVTVLSPAAGTTVAPGQTVTLQVRATDDTAVRRVVFAASGVFTASSTQDVNPPAASVELTFPVALPSGTSAGDLILTAEAVDTANNSSGPISRTVTVTDIVAPTVQVTAPPAGVPVDPRQPLQVTVQASDAVGVAQITLTASGAAAFSETRTISPVATARTETFTLNLTPPIAGGTLTLSATGRDQSGNAGQSPAVAVPVQDVVAPTVASIQPVDGATGVDPQSIVVIEFSEPMENATVSAANVTLLRGTTVEPVTIGVNSDGRIVTLTPQSRPLPLNATFTVTVGAGLTDRAGNPLAQARTFTFQTIAPDTAGPRVQTTTPIAGAVGVALTTNIDVTFSEPIATTSVTPQSFRVSVGGVPVAGTFSFLDVNARARFAPAAPFATDAIVVVELTPGITDVAGNSLVDANGQPLTAPFTFTFVTGSFGIVYPAAESSVVENSAISIEARASAALGVSSVVYTVNGQALPAASGPTFAATFPVPSAASTPTLTILASARNAQGNEIATDTRLVHVVVGLRVTPPLAGIAVGGSLTLRFSTTSAAAEAVQIQLRAGDPTLVSFPVNPVVLPAGQMSVDAAITGEAVGNTAIFGESNYGTASAIVSVSEVVPGQTFSPTASLVGTSLVNPPSAGVVTITSNVVPEWSPLAGLTSWWRGDGNALDAVGTNHGTLQNGAAYATGQFGQAFTFDGVDDQIVVPHNANLNAGTGITIAAWVNPTSIGHARPIAQKRSSGNVGGYTLETADQPSAPDDSVQWVLWINGQTVILQTPANVLQPGVWRHVAATYDGESMKIFVDGTQRASLSIAGAVADSTEPFVIGRNVVIPSFAWHGLLDEVEVYQRPLSTAEIEALARRGTPDPGGQTRTVDVVVLSAPAASSTNVSITSSNPAVAMATSGPIAAGSQTATLLITAGEAGTATLIIRAGGETRSLKVVVGGASPFGIPYVFGPPVGVSVLPAPSAGYVIAAAGEQSTLALALLSTPAGAQTPVTVTSTNPAVATATAGVIAAGDQTTQVSITTLANGVTTIVLRAGGVTRLLTVVVGTPAPNAIPLIAASPVGVSSIRGPRAGEIFAPTAAARTVRVRFLNAPAANDTQVDVTSSDPAVATATSPAVIHAGEQTLDVVLATGNAGRATLTFSAAGQTLTLDVAVGIDAVAEKTPLVSSAPAGVSIARAGSVGHVIAPASVVSLPTLKIPLLTTPAAGPIQVTVTSGAPSLVSFGGAGSTTVTIAQGEQTIELPLSISGTPGATLLFFEFEGQRRELLVIVGNPPNSQLPLLTAPVVGVEIK
ncbi:MAG: Ig-like domain-containing protein [Vicinamibacterales bacterium]